MLYEYLLISVVIACGYWGWFFVRRPPNGTPMFGAMQLAAAALAALGLLGRWKFESQFLGIAGAIGLGAGMCLLVVGPLVRWAARRFAAAERLGVASRLLDIAEILAPGSGVAEEKAVLGAMTEIRDGRIDDTVDALVAAKDRAPAEARVAIDERIALLYLAAYRWRDAIAHAETHLFGALAELSEDPDEPEQSGPIAAAQDPDMSGAPRSLRQLLGLAPPVWVELLGAYGRTGDMERAGRMLARLEDVCAGHPEAAMWIHRGRLMFLALAGRTASVKALVEPHRSRHMSAAARTYWVAVAHEHEGDRAAAAAAYEKARARTRGRPRVLIDEALARLADPAQPARAPLTSDVVARIEAAPLPPPVKLEQPRRSWATWGLTGALLAVAGAISAFVGPSHDLGVLVRSGAMVRSLVDAGEWWRLVACVFVHVGAVHLFVNAIGMFFLGRVAEALFGGARTVALFGLSGLAGSVASYLEGPAEISAGASGAVFGLLGAVFIELTLHRAHYRAAWKRGLWGGVVVVTIAQLAVGYFYPVIDRWAHGAGLGAGVLFGALLSPRVRWAAIARHAARAIAVAFAGLALAAGALVAQTSIADSYGALPQARRTIAGVALDAPATWRGKGMLTDPGEFIEVRALRRPSTMSPERWIARAVDDLEQSMLAPVAAPIAPLPPGWYAREWIASFDDPLGGAQHLYILVAARTFGNDVVILSLRLPETMARAAPAWVAGFLASAKPAP